MQTINNLPYERSVVIHVGGRVQGVGFRFSVYQQAQKHHLVGYVKNLSSGEVEIIACGTNNELQIFIDWIIAGGPASAKIAFCDVNEIETSEHYTSFNVRY